MQDFHLISHHLCPYVQRAVIVLNEKNIPFQRSYIDLANKPDWFRHISPLGRVPILQTADSVLFESQVIAEYLDEITPGSLHPADPLKKARHRSWIEFASATLAQIAGFYNAPDAETFASSRTALHECFARIEPEIAGDYFADGHFQMIDGVWGTVFRYLDVFEQIDSFALLTGLPNCQRWRQNIALRPSVRAAPPKDYPARLMTFLKNRESHLATLIN